MKQKKKIVRSILAVLASACCVTTFAACGGCDGCDKTGHQHTWNDATCTEPKTCSECGATEGEAMGHNYGTNGIQEVAATCTEDGYTYGECIVCHAVERKQNPALGHDYKTTTESVTCTSDGVTVYDCKNCDDEYSEITTRTTGHNVADAKWTLKSEQPHGNSECLYDVTEKATCQASGCGAEVTRSYTVHKGKYTAEVVPATCRAKGSITYTCACGDEKYTYTVETDVNANAHHWITDSSGNATHVCDVTGCGATQNQIAVEGNYAQLAAEDLKKDNLAIAMNNTVMQPDEALLKKIGSADVELSAETVNPNDVTMDAATQQKVEESGAQIYNFDLRQNGQNVNFDGGKMTVSIPYKLAPGEDPNSISILYIAEDGTAQEYDAVYTNGNAVFQAEHFSFYTVVRVSPAERCKKVGHDYQETEVKPNCLEAGYTIENCRRCGDFKTTPGAKATGHNYNETVVNPTCTEKGYTLYECNNCPDNYVSKWVKVIPHAYTDKVVAPTCTDNGYTEHTCSGCGKTYRDTYVTATGHSYVNGTCSACGAKENAKDANNIYFNLIDSLASMRSYYVNVNDVHIEFTQKLSNQEKGNTMDIEMDFYRMSVSMDENGNIEGKGEGKMTQKTKQLNSDGSVSDYVYSAEIKMVLQNGKAYMYTKDSESRDNNTTNVHENYSMSSMETVGGNEEMMAAIKAIYEENVQPITESVKTLADSPLNAVIASVVEYVFDKVQTEDGYTFTLNYDHLKEVYDSLTTESFKTVFEKVFGTGSFDSVVSWVNALPNKTVGGLVDEVLPKLSSIGIEKEQLYEAINAVLKQIPTQAPGAPAQSTPELTVENILEKYKDKTVAQIIIMTSGGEMTEKDFITNWKGMVSQVVTVLSDANTPCLDTVYNLIGSLSGKLPGDSVGGSGNVKPYPPTEVDPGVKPDYPPTEVKPMAAMLSEQAAVSLSEMVRAFDTQITAAVEAAKSGSIINFKTDAKGKLLSYDVQFKDFDLSLDIPYAGDVRPGEESAEPITNQINIKADGTATVMTGGDFAGNVGTVVKALDNAAAVFTNVADGTKVAGIYDSLVFKKVDGVTVLIPELKDGEITNEYLESEKDIVNLVDAKYEDKDCYKLTVRTYRSAYILMPEKGISFSKDCGSWNRYSVNCVEDRGVELDIYYVGNEILHAEYNIDELLEMYKQYEGAGNGYYDMCSVLYNTVTKKFADYSQHNYVQVDEKQGKCDIYTVKKYRCASCGNTRTEYIWVGHQTESTYELKDKTKGCAGGIVETRTCKDCKKSWKYDHKGVYDNGTHYTVRTETPLTSKCGDLKLVEDKCLCGEYVRNVEIYGRCEFDPISKTSTPDDGKSYYRYNKSVYRCAVTECQYTYTVVSYYKTTDKNCHYDYYREYTLQDGSVHKVTPREEEIHNYSWVDSKEGDLDVIKYTCSGCKDVREVQKYKTFDKEFRVQVYHYFVYGGYGWMREYRDPCHFTEYNLGENEQIMGTGREEVYHEFGTVSSIDTQGNERTETLNCAACGEQARVIKSEFFTDEKSEYSRVTYYFDYASKTGFVRVFDNHCNYVEYELDENGVKTDRMIDTGTDHIEYSMKVGEPTCTQLEDYEIHCFKCDKVEHFYNYADEHSYYYDSSKDTYVCKVCGLENESEADGPISLEEHIEGDAIEIGYNVRYRRNTVGVEVYLNFELENEVKIELPVELNDKVTTKITMMNEEDIRDKYYFWPLNAGKQFGTFTVSKTALIQAIDDYLAAHPEYQVQQISIVMVAEGRILPEDEYPDYIYNTINYLPEELAA